MLKLQEVLYAISAEQIQKEADDRYFGEWLFSEWRERYIAILLKAVRHGYRMRERGFRTNVRPEWCNAAALLLELAPVQIQDQFLRSSVENKNRMVSAVLADGGVLDDRDRFVELPPL